MALSSQDKPKQSLNSRIAYALTDRKILHFRYDAHLRQQVMKQLSKTQRELLNRLAAAGVDALPKKQLDTLLKELKQEVAKVYQEMTAYTQDELSGFFTAETKHIHQLYNDEAGFDFFNQVPEYKQKANKTATIIAGSPLEDWWAKQGNDFAFKFEGIIRQGLLDGQQTSQMISDVKHLMNTSRRHAETLVITAVAKVADNAHQALRDENLDILAGEKHLSTLDTRTSTVCQLRDGLMWDLDKKPIDHDVPYQRPPLHPRCRSILQLVTKSWKELGIDAEEMPSSTRASQDSPVSEQINYENWLKSKSPEQQDQVLGKGKADLWRRGVITFADMLDQSGRPLTLAELQGDRIVSWLTHNQYKNLKKAVEKLPHFADTLAQYHLTEEEGLAIYAYTTNLYRKINTKMRNGKLTPKDTGFIAVLQTGLSRLPSFEGITYRRIKELKGFDFTRYKKGSVITESAFTSSSKKESLTRFGEYVVFEIYGKNGKSITRLSKYPYQYEVLFNENSRFLVEDYDDKSKRGVIRITLKEL
ncbi:ADP-ribosyltransferase domain-containing protein [Glaesserella parasuis]|nr:ADP-ribosyltransferase domain-containing protein [Glaesserella parasuis]